MAVQIQLRHDTAANWTTVDPTLMVGEVGVETDTSKMKIGTGVDAWTVLPYYNGGAGTVMDVTVGNTATIVGTVTTSNTYPNISLDLTNTTVTAGTYGDATNIPQIVIDSKGRITSAGNTAVFIPSGSISVTGGDLTLSGNTGTAITNATLANTTVTSGTYGDATTIPTFTVDSKGRLTSAGNVSVTFPPAFSGNLAGNALYDSTNNSVSIKAFPINNISSITNSATQYATRAVTYSGANLNAPSGTYQTAGAKLQANISLSSGGGSNKQTAGHAAVAQFVNPGGLGSNDRVRGQSTLLAIDLNGNDWGNDGSTSIGRTTAAGIASTSTIEGSGTMGHAIGAFNSVLCTPSGGGNQITNYASGSFSSIVSQGGNSFTSVATGTARLYSGTMVLSAGHAVTNAIGFHLHSGWASTSGGASITNKYGILIEDTNSPIKTSGLVDAVDLSASSTLTVGSLYSSSGTTSIFGGNVVIHPYPGDITLRTDAGFGKIVLDGQITQGLQYTNFTSGAWDIGTTYVNPTQIIDNNGLLNITITPSAVGSLGSVYDFFIVPKATGTSVSWPAGSYVTGSYDDTLYANNYARVSIDGNSGIAKVAYISNAGKAFSSNISAPTFTGNVVAPTATITGSASVTNVLTLGNYASSAMPSGSLGSVVAVSDAGGKLAYWDTANTRWSYVFDNSAV